MPSKVNSRVTLLHGRVFKLIRENVTLTNGITVDLDIIRHPGASAMVPLSDKNTVILIKQYRHAIGILSGRSLQEPSTRTRHPLNVPKESWPRKRGFWQMTGKRWEKSLRYRGTRMSVSTSLLLLT